MARTRQTKRRPRITLRNINEVINLLDEEHSPVEALSIELSLVLDHQSQHACLEMDWCTSHLREYRHDFEHVSEWVQLGAALGRNTTVRKLELQGMYGIMINANETNLINAEVYQCIEALFRGIQLNTSIQKLRIDLGLFPCNVRESIEMDRNASDTAFQRILFVCSKVKKLEVRCVSLSQYAAVASLMGDSRSILSDLTIHGSMDRESLSAIAAGLVNNTALKYLYIEYSGEMSPVAKVLCDTSSIERVIASNHTLESIILFCNVNPIIQKYLTLNKNTNKELVIRTKIARYYFQGEFDISTFASMNVKCLPRVLAMIGGGESYQTNQNAVRFRKKDAIYQQSAIFRLLKCIPDICNVSSRCVGKVEGLEVSDSSKRQKVSK
eukprot:scaffold7160_cov52-Cyclotella_meneghiniana.AAC.1